MHVVDLSITEYLKFKEALISNRPFLTILLVVQVPLFKGVVYALHDA
jgi:hypothetical protein